MIIVKVVVPVVLVALFLAGCGGDEKYPSTATVKLVILEQDKTLSEGQLSLEIVEAQMGSIMTYQVLAKAVDGNINKVVWTNAGTPAHPECSTEELIRTRLLDLTTEETGVILGKRLEDAMKGRKDLTAILAMRAGESGKYSREEMIEMLQRNLVVRAGDEVDLIDITYFSDDKEEARDVADIMAAAYISFLDEENARKIEALRKFAADYQKAQVKISSNMGITGLRNDLADIQRTRKLTIDENGNFTEPLDISRKRTEKIKLQPEILIAESDLNRVKTMALSGQVRFLGTKGHTNITETSEEVSRLRIEVKRLGIKFEENSPKVLVAKKKLLDKESQLNTLVRDVISEMEKTLSTKKDTSYKLDEEIKKFQDDFFTGTAEYQKISLKLKAALDAQKITADTRREVSFGVFLGASISSPPEISLVKVKRPGVLNTRTILIWGGIGFIVVLNVIFVIFIVRWAKKKSRSDYQNRY